VSPILGYCSFVIIHFFHPNGSSSRTFLCKPARIYSSAKDCCALSLRLAVEHALSPLRMRSWIFFLLVLAVTEVLCRASDHR